LFGCNGLALPNRWPAAPGSDAPDQALAMFEPLRKINELTSILEQDCFFFKENRRQKRLEFKGLFADEQACH
jgi:hypothetical protein